MKAYNLSIRDKKQETLDAVSLTIALSEEIKDAFTYKAGQYLTLEAEINGEKVRRAYSMSSSPTSNLHPTITVKKVTDGKMSNFLCDTINVGDPITVFPPDGRFLVNTNSNNKKHYALFGAGSGITPLMSILKTVLSEEPNSKVSLFYGNKNADSIIFKAELAHLAEKHDNRFQVIHYLSKADGNWTGKRGRIDGEQTSYLVQAYLSDLKEDIDCYICGPGAMIDNVQDALKTQGISESNIHREFFVSSKENEAPAESESISDIVSIGFKFDDETHTLEANADKSILDSIIDAGFEVPYSCQAGACCSCMALLTEGEATTQTQDMLTNAEKQEGLRLTCQARPLTNKLFVDFDEA